MLTPSARIALRLAFFYGAIFASVGIFLPYWPIWLESRGLSAVEIGLIIGASFWPRIVTSLVVPNLADRFGRRRLAMTLMTALTLIGLLAFALVSDFWLFMLLSLLTGATWSCILPLAEAISLDRTAEAGLDYGRVRLWGSITFILMAIIGGFALERAGAPAIFALLITTTALTLIACLFMPDSTGTPTGAEATGLGHLFRRLDLWLLVMASSLIQASHTLLYNFGSIHWRAVGHSEITIGWLWAEGVIAEVVFFALSARLIKRLSLPKLLMIAGILTSIRWILNGLSASLPLLVFTQGLHAASFALTMLATLQYLRQTTPPELQASAQGFYVAVGFAPLSGLISLISGWLYGAAAGQAFFAMAAMAAAGTALAVLLETVTKPAATLAGRM
ncbi:MAG: MFS transporter [Alphaproteobacteria bacterium]|nr:MFS transporter [Alphaproteobacteria bacterium]